MFLNVHLIFLAIDFIISSINTSNKSFIDTYSFSASHLNLKQTQLLYYLQ